MLQICFVLLPAQGNCFQVANYMLFPCLRFEPSYISWPSHIPTGEKENVRKVPSYRERARQGVCVDFFPLKFTLF